MLRLRPLTAAACLLGIVLAGVDGVRVYRLTRGTPPLDGPDERTWHVWAYRDPSAAAVFSRLAACPEATGPLDLRVPRYPDWWATMARYYLPHRPLIGAKITRLLSMAFLRRLGLLGPETPLGRLQRSGASATEILRAAEKAGWEGDPVLAERIQARQRRLMISTQPSTSDVVTAFLGGDGSLAVWQRGRRVCPDGALDSTSQEAAP